MQGKELVALRKEALDIFAALPADRQPIARGWQRRLAIVATAVTLSGALIIWLNVAGVFKTTPTEEAAVVQSVSIEAQTPPPDVEIARSFEIVAAANPTERTEEAPAAVPPEPEALLPKFLAWAADKDMSVPMENAQPLKVTPAKDAQAKASSQDREREQEARADRKWEERHARRLAAARKNVRRAPQPAPNASNTPPIVPREADSWRGG
jgi:hypothetical protein